MYIDIINQYTDLTSYQARNLARQTFKGPMTAAFLRDGLVTPDRQLTEAGRNVLDRYIAFEDKGRDDPVIALLPYARLLKLPEPYHKLRSVHRKLLIVLARFPGLAYKWICKVYGAEVLDTLKDAGLVDGDSVRGAPQRLTDDGQQVVKQTLYRHMAGTSKGGGD